MSYSSNLTGKTIGNIKVSMLSQFIRFVIQIFGNLVFTYFLLPEDFGHIAMAQTIIGLLNIFKDMGLMQPIIQFDRISKTQKSSIFWLNISVTTILSILLILIAPIIATFFQQDELFKIICLLIIPFYLNSLGMVHEGFLRRYLRIALVAKIQLFSMIFSYTIALISLYFFKNYYIIILQQIVFAAINLLFILIYYQWLPAFVFELKRISPFYKFGIDVLGSNLLNFSSRNIDNVLIGKVFGISILGQYNRAYSLLTLPLNQINNPIGNALLPTLSRVKNIGESYRKVYFSTVTSIVFVLYPAFVLSFYFAQNLFDLFFGDKWNLSVVYFKILIINSFIQVITNTFGWLFVSQGRSKDIFHWTLIGSCINILAFVSGMIWGVTGMIWLYTILGYSLKAPIITWLLCKKGPIRLKDFKQLVLLGMASVIMTFSVIFLLEKLNLNFHFLMKAGAVYAVVLIITLPLLPKYITNKLKNKLNQFI
ncbi:MAG: lipopolysaccharide biosynthesis protein [Reichenbachiella sp.]|uniref:lipopolysaccharide biosynthesis protein n=1 Tax=Reichenbachiella sp. TaxID=2184521 RepID=UPI002965E502|nr:lipopolysaccharide biosynthesis protein [Reichenbachiella sp.]MDW3208237.1 lipopolysaccharide biosynthesis protein [Reichenbachiella sp.]